ncbi:MAG: tRNA (adenosine(37)-N6)-threonylcarbamoyltransferase complex transferase subunit TsaD [Thermomicrobia bacterium]|nr:tRNA (adenosine(37)-N6)-threonylcarbamoyltransferase complex transferase subunit TsaD [Thermomicrobia bacterium]
MDILAIESSCDETAAAVIRGGRCVRSSIIASQNDLHARYGGVVPELASRRHVTEIVPVVRAALDEAGCTFDDLDALAVTMGPGLAGSLLVGVNVAKSLACARALPLIGVNHLEGHLYANWLVPPGQADAPEPQFPAIGLIVSGGHTSLVLMTGHGAYRLLGSTLDDAAGEAFDKGARLLGLGYPGGPAISRTAAMGDPAHFPFAHARTDNPSDFSFSGIKTALLRAVAPYRLPDEPMAERSVATPFTTHRPIRLKEETPVADLAAGYEDAIVAMLVAPVARAAREYRAASVLLAGGVAANRLLRERLAAAVDVPLFCPPPIYCTDNAAMIGAAAERRMQADDFAGWDLDVQPSLRLVVSSR